MVRSTSQRSDAMEVPAASGARRSMTRLILAAALLMLTFFAGRASRNAEFREATHSCLNVSD